MPINLLVTATHESTVSGDQPVVSTLEGEDTSSLAGQVVDSLA